MVSKIRLIATGLLLICSVANGEDFDSLCERRAELGPDSRRTVDAMLALSGTEDCAAATRALAQMPGLMLPAKGLVDLAPIAAFDHWQMVVLGMNQIEDPCPLATITGLGYLDLSGNRIGDVDCLASLNGLRSLTLLDNPVERKICPITPGRLCAFDDDGAVPFQAGVAAFEEARYGDAIGRFDEAAEIYRRTRDPIRLSDALERQASVQLEVGRYGEALDGFQAVLQSRQEMADSTGLLLSYTGVAAIYDRLGRPDKAVPFHRAALDNIESQESSQQLFNRNPLILLIEKGEVLRGLGLAQARAGSIDEGLESVAEALRIAREVPLQDTEGIRLRQRAEIAALDATATILLRAGRAAAAGESARQAVEIALGTEDLAALARAQARLARALELEDEGEKAIETYQAALASARESGNQPVEAEILQLFGERELRSGNFEEAILRLGAATELFSGLRPGLQDRDKISLIDTQLASFRSLQAALIGAGRIEEALVASELGRARAFVELMSSRYLEDPEFELEVSSDPLADLSSLIDDHDLTLIEYAILDESRLVAWLAAPGREIELHEIDLGALDLPLVELIARARLGMGVEAGRGFGVEAEAIDDHSTPTSLLADLHEILIAPLADLLPDDPRKPVAIIPQGPLFLVPFAALEDPSGRPLIEHHTLLSAPSIQVLGLLDEHRDLATDGTLLVGNPTMPSVRLDIDDEAETLPPLPGAEAEAKAIAELIGAEALIGSEATKSAVIEGLLNAEVAHFATHGLLADFRGLGVPGAIALSPSAEDDGLLSSSEIAELELDARLVVLSACNTGRGEITGDGVVGLARALLGAGTDSVVVSLWSVPDAPTTELMIAFYEALENGVGTASALRLAMLETRKKHPHPRDWAAFTLIGSPGR